MTALPN